MVFQSITWAKAMCAQTQSPSRVEVAHDGIHVRTLQQAINNIITLDIKKAVSSTLSIEWEREDGSRGDLISWYTYVGGGYDPPSSHFFNRKLCHRM